MRNLSDPFKCIVAIVVSELAGVIGSFFTSGSIDTWYAGLVKPALNPPAVVFGPVWITLYALMGIALFLVWKRHSFLPLRVFRKAVSVFFIQLALNAVWSPIFFGLEDPLLAFFDIVLLWFAILYTTILFFRISRTAAYLLLPYLLWVTFAAYLNYAILTLN